MTTILNYTIIKPIYESLNSLVYRALRNDDNQPVILKMLKEDYPTPAELSRYRQEYELLRLLNGQGVIQTYTLEKYQNTLVIVLEDMGGDSLKYWMTNPTGKNKISLTEFLTMAIQLVETLGDIHAANIIHKDINPSNIIFNFDTKQLKIIDFGLASRLPRENPTLKNPNQLEGTLAYISPEQTGRVNRVLDYRTDLYSLGVTFYEMLTGQLPFGAKDAMGLVHCHLAKHPVPPMQLVMTGFISPSLAVNYQKQAIPLQLLSNLILKLMAKNAEDRYQSAFGLKWDLAQIGQQLTTSPQTFATFVLGQNDFSGHFQIPSKLYGREAEIQTLLTAFERVTTGTTEMMLVAGYSGVGKSSLVNEIHKPITEKRGHFVAGKYDQYQRSIPYSALTLAFNQLCDYLLKEPADQVARWRSKILQAVGNYGQVLIEVIPELAKLIGEQPPVPEVNPQAAQNRFNSVLRNFIQVVSHPEYPLVLFIDDLQWADSPSLDLLKVLMTDEQSRYFLVIGAYRDNEVNPAHPFVMMMEEIKKVGVPVNTLTLPNLRPEHLNQLLAETLHQAPQFVQPLTQLVYEKTLGNAFFATQFLKSLYQEELLRFNYSQRQWQWNVQQIYERRITDNVVELMARKITKLPATTQTVLKLAAGIGAVFDINTLAIIYENEPPVTFQHLWEALVEGLILPLDEHYKLIEVAAELGLREVSFFKFLHDRIQQAAYSLIPEEQKPTIHLQIGRLLLKNTPKSSLEERIFEIVAQLNVGRSLIHETEEAQRLVELNLLAGRKAMSAIAYRPALEMFKQGLAALPSATPWETHFELTFELYNELALCEYRSSLFQAADEHFQLLTTQAQTPQQIGKVYGEAVYLHTTMNEYLVAIELARQGLARLGMTFPPVVTVEILAEEFRQVKETLGNRQIADLLASPVLTDPEKIALFDILNMAIPSTWLAMPPGFAWCTLQMVKLSHQYGNTTMSAFGFGIHALLLCGQPEEYQAGLEYGELAIALNERFPNLFVRGTIHFFFNCFVQHWRRPKKLNVLLHKIAHQSCSEGGAYVYGVYNVIFFFFQSFCSELTLTEVQNYYKQFFPFVEKVNDQDVLGVLKSLLQLMANLQGGTTARDSLEDDQFNEARYFSQLTTRDYGNGLCYYYFTKMFLAFFFEQFEEAIQMAAALQPYYVYTHGLYHRALYHFYLALSLTASYPKQSPAAQKTTWEALQGHRDCLANWAVQSPDNYQHQYVLVCAEMARISNQPWEALTLYEQAILFARANEVLVHEALANELAAKFYFARQLDKIGMVYLKEAYRLYQLWEAKSKIKYLEERYPRFLRPAVSSTSLFTTSLSLPLNNTMLATSYYKGNSSTMTPMLDLASVLKASQALAGEIVLKKLLKNMMAIVLENAGAERGCLLLPQQEDWLIEAEIQVDSGEVPVLQAIPLDHYPQIATTIIRYVARSQKVVVLNNATVEGLFTQDPYILTKRPLSVLGAPLKNQGRLSGILYLENNLTTGAFTPDRLEILNFLSSQMAVSIENAKLYAELHEREQTVKQFLEAMPVGVAVHHPDGTLYYVNKKGTQLFGKGMVRDAPPEEQIETYQLCLAGTQQPYPSDRAPVVLALQGQTVSVDDLEIHQPAKTVPVEAWGTPVFDEQDQIAYAIVAFQDITERKQAEAAKLRLVQEQEAKNAALRYSREIEAKNAELVRLNQEKNEFLGIAAHDLKNPLSAILGLADLITLDFDGLLKEEVIDYANGIAISAKQMFDLIVNLLDVNRIESGQFNLSLQPTDLVLLVQPILKGYQERATAKQIQLHSPLLTAPYLALIDPNITRQVLDNLISNAIKYSPPGRNVSVRLLQTGAVVRCEIQDEGPGLSDTDLQKLFGKFARLTAQPTGGEHSTGLGLFIVKKLVTAMNGKVWCESELGKGATFVVEFARVS